jgi:retron-type reverse transcriptase
MDSETLDGYSNQTIEEVLNTLKDHSLKFKPVRRMYIPKKDGSLRPLGIPSPRDKVIQKAMATVLDEIYEPKFLNSSFGFRSGRGTHGALKQATLWKGTR